MKEAILFTLNLIDAIITVYWVQLYGVSVEANPMMSFVLSLGAVQFILLKLLVMVGIIYVIRRCKYNIALNFGIISFLVIVCQNLYPAFI